LSNPSWAIAQLGNIWVIDCTLKSLRVRISPGLLVIKKHKSMDITTILSFTDKFFKLAHELEDRYIGIGLDPESKSALLDAVPPKFGTKIGKKKSPGNVFADHVTIEIDPTEDMLTMFGEGERIPIKVLGECYDEKAQAVIVSLPEFIDSHIRMKDRLPHITISTNRGVSPVYSNELVNEGTNFSSINLTIQGHVKFLKR
jgi:hypothetical protein